MAFIITNTQEALRRKPGAIHCTFKAYLDDEGEWTITRPAKTFATHEEALIYLRDGGLDLGRFEDEKGNTVNTIAIEEG